MVPARTHPAFRSINSHRGRYTSDPESRQAGHHRGDHHQVGDHKDGHPGQVDHHLRELSQGHHHHEVGGYGHHQVGYVGHHQVGHHQVGQVGGQVGHPVTLATTSAIRALADKWDMGSPRVTLVALLATTVVVANQATHTRLGRTEDHYGESTMTTRAKMRTSRRSRSSRFGHWWRSPDDPLGGATSRKVTLKD